MHAIASAKSCGSSHPNRRGGFTGETERTKQQETAREPDRERMPAGDDVGLRPCSPMAMATATAAATPSGDGGGAAATKITYSTCCCSASTGMHAVDYLNCVKAGTCPNLAALGQTGVNYLATSTSKPSDSFPGLTAIISGGSPQRKAPSMTSRTIDRSIRPRRRPATDSSERRACVLAAQPRPVPRPSTRKASTSIRAT